MEPSVGRIVHYQSYGTPGGEHGSLPRAAIITCLVSPTATEPDRVGLAIFNPTGVFFNTSVPFSAEPEPGHWSWPPRT